MAAEARCAAPPNTSEKEMLAAFLGYEDRTLRWTPVHMIDETARYNGHPGILRELIDGATGA